jgi:hypothetical protein
MESLCPKSKNNEGQIADEMCCYGDRCPHCCVNYGQLDFQKSPLINVSTF